MEYGGTPLSRAVINVNVAFQELGRAGHDELRTAAGGWPGRGGAETPPPAKGGRLSRP